jgi:hypothetical protein
MLRRPQLRSTFARAVVPVVGGIAFFAVLFGALYGVAALISHNSSTTSEILAGRTFQPGSVRTYASIVQADGPIIFPDLLGTDGDKTVVLDHTGTDPMRGWVIYLGHPADRPISCKVTQVRSTRQFTDCDGRTIDVEQLSPPPAGVAPAVSVDGVLSLDLVPDSVTTPPGTSAG